MWSVDTFVDCLLPILEVGYSDLPDGFYRTSGSLSNVFQWKEIFVHNVKALLLSLCQKIYLISRPFLLIYNLTLTFIIRSLNPLRLDLVKMKVGTSEVTLTFSKVSKDQISPIGNNF